MVEVLLSLGSNKRIHMNIKQFNFVMKVAPLTGLKSLQIESYKLQRMIKNCFQKMKGHGLTTIHFAFQHPMLPISWFLQRY